MQALSSARLLLAMLLAFGSEIILWPHTPGRDLFDWAASAVGYLALAAILPDLMRRFRVRDVIGLLALAGLAGLVTGVLAHPRTALAEMPLTLISRVLGAQTAVALAMLGLWLALLRGRTALWLFVAAPLGGFVWGLFGRWFPITFDPAAGETPLALLLVAGGVGLAAIALVGRATGGQPLQPDDFLLPGQMGAGAIAALLALGLLRAAQGQSDPFALAAAVLLAAFLLLILRLYRRTRAPGLLAVALPPRGPDRRFLVPAVVFLLAGVIAYLLPRAGTSADPLAVLGALQVAFGVVWLPALSLITGGQMLIREIRAQQL